MLCPRVIETPHAGALRRTINNFTTHCAAHAMADMQNLANYRWCPAVARRGYLAPGVHTAPTWRVTPPPGPACASDARPEHTPVLSGSRPADLSSRADHAANSRPHRPAAVKDPFPQPLARRSSHYTRRLFYQPLPTSIPTSTNLYQPLYQPPPPSLPTSASPAGRHSPFCP